MFRKLIYLTVALVGLSATTTHAEILVPGGLNPGDMYYLAFVTDGTRNGKSSLITDYNQFVRDEAARSGAITETYGIDWFAIGSTQAVDARDNAFVDGDRPHALASPCFSWPSCQGRRIQRSLSLVFARTSLTAIGFLDCERFKQLGVST